MPRLVRTLVWTVLALSGVGAAHAQPASIDPQLLKPNLIEVEPGRRMHFACGGPRFRSVPKAPCPWRRCVARFTMPRQEMRGTAAWIAAG